MEPKPSFSIKLALSQGWATYKANFGFLFVTFILYMLISGILSGIQSYLQEQESPMVIIPIVISMVIGSLIGIGWVRIGLKLLRGETAEYEDLLRGTDRLLSYFLGSLLVGLIVIAGLILLIVPGVYWALKYMYVPYLIADKNLKIGEAMKQSALMTNGVKLKLIGYGFVQIGLVIAGTLALLIGLIAVLPAIWLASLSIYMQLLNENTESSNSTQEPPQQVEYLAQQSS